jgi:hypothetical protein
MVRRDYTNKANDTAAWLLLNSHNPIWLQILSRDIFKANCNLFAGISPESTTEWANLLRRGKPTTQLAVQRPSAPTISVVILQILVNIISLEPGRFSVQKARMNNQLIREFLVTTATQALHKRMR